MPYDMPMSLDEALMDPETRRRALAYLGGSGDAVPVPPTGVGTGNWFREPVGTTGTPSASSADESGPVSQGAASADDLIRRYLDAQQSDRSQERLSALGAGFGNAAETVLGGVGVRYARTPYQAPHTVEDLLQAERTKAEVARANRPTGATSKAAAMTDEQARAAFEASYPNAPRALVANVTAGNFEQAMMDQRAKAGAAERAGAMTRREEAERQRLEVLVQEGRLRRAVDWARLGQQADEAGASRGFRLYLFEKEQDAKDRERAEKAADKEAAVAVPGYDVELGAKPTPKDAETLKAQSAAARNMASHLKALRELYAKYGTEMGGKAATNMRQAVIALQIEAKNVMGLGALSGPDMDLMHGITVEDPTSIGANTKGLFGYDTIGDALDGVQEWIDRTMEGNAGARGYRKTPAGAPPKRAPITDALPKDNDGRPSLDAGGQIKVRNKKTGETRWLNPTDAFQLLAKPDKYERAK